MLLPDNRIENIPREELQQLIEDHFYDSLKVDKEQVKKEFFSISNETRHDEISKRKISK